MRRGFSIFLILIFGLGPLTAFVDGSEDANLPPCCRRHGAHHCAMYQRILAMRAQQALDPKPAVTDPLTCPNYPGPTIAMLMPAHAVTADMAEPAPAWTAISHVPAARYESVASASLRAHAGRGPPQIKCSDCGEPELRIAIKLAS
jgi:hypothetical protein